MCWSHCVSCTTADHQPNQQSSREIHVYKGCGGMNLYCGCNCVFDYFCQPLMMISLAEDGPEPDNPEPRNVQNDTPSQGHGRKWWLGFNWCPVRSELAPSWHLCRTTENPVVNWHHLGGSQTSNKWPSVFSRSWFLPRDGLLIAFGPHLDVRDDHKTVGTPNAMSQGSSQGHPRYPTIRSSGKGEDCSMHPPVSGVPQLC